MTASVRGYGSVALGAEPAALALPERPRPYYEARTRACLYTDSEGRTLPYRLFLPAGYAEGRPHPLLLCFHGAGERGDDNVTQLRPWACGWVDEVVQARHPCIILMPQCPADQQWVNTPFAGGSYSLERTPVSAPMKRVHELVAKAVRELPVDRSRIYVMGASMGGYGTWDFIMRQPGLVAAAAPVCGAGDPSMAASIRDVPVWAFHGDRDTGVPTSGSVEMVDAIRAAGGTKAALTLYPGVGHESYEMAWKERSLVEWVFNQRKAAPAA